MNEYVLDRRQNVSTKLAECLPCFREGHCHIEMQNVLAEVTESIKCKHALKPRYKISYDMIAFQHLFYFVNLSTRKKGLL